MCLTRRTLRGRLRLVVLISGVVGAAALIAAAALLSPGLWLPIGGYLGLVFWILGCSRVHPRRPFACRAEPWSTLALRPCCDGVLGGPGGCGVASANASSNFESSEVFSPGRGGVPWYGTLYNHSAVLIPPF